MLAWIYAQKMAELHAWMSDSSVSGPAGDGTPSGRKTQDLRGTSPSVVASRCATFPAKLAPQPRPDLGELLE